MATITIVGNLTDDPELRFLGSGAAMCRFSVAENRRFQDRNKEWQEETSFHNVVCWRDLAENVCNSVRKGQRVVVTGRLQQRSYTTESGEKRSSWEITADELGPSLRWATADVTKTQSPQGGGRPQAPAAQAQREPAPVMSGDAGGFDPYNSDEPF